MAWDSSRTGSPGYRHGETTPTPASGAGDRDTGRLTEAEFEWCDVRWGGPERTTEHQCARHYPGHEKHVCCCGEAKP